MQGIELVVERGVRFHEIKGAIKAYGEFQSNRAAAFSGDVDSPVRKSLRLSSRSRRSYRELTHLFEKNSNVRFGSEAVILARNVGTAEIGQKRSSIVMIHFCRLDAKNFIEPILKLSAFRHPNRQEGALAKADRDYSAMLVTMPTISKIFVFALTAGILTGCGVARDGGDRFEQEWVTAVITGSAETPDPILVWVRQLEREGRVRDVTVLESFPVQIRLTAPQDMIDELNVAKRKLPPDPL